MGKTSARRPTLLWARTQARLSAGVASREWAAKQSMPNMMPSYLPIGSARSNIEGNFLFRLIIAE
jgi:hypothetical protein